MNLKSFNIGYWVHCGSDALDSLHRWVVGNCLEFEEVKITRVAKYVGAIIGRDGYLHRWTATRNTFVKVCRKMNESSGSVGPTPGGVQKLCVVGIELCWLHSRT